MPVVSPPVRTVEVQAFAPPLLFACPQYESSRSVALVVVTPAPALKVEPAPVLLLETSSAAATVVGLPDHSSTYIEANDRLLGVYETPVNPAGMMQAKIDMP